MCNTQLLSLIFENEPLPILRYIVITIEFALLVLLLIDVATLAIILLLLNLGVIVFVIFDATNEVEDDAARVTVVSERLTSCTTVPGA